jgi:Fibronectin type III domain
MISKNKLFSIGKLLIATLLLLATSANMAKAVPDPAAPSDTNAVYPLPDGSSAQINWIDNTLDEIRFRLVFTKINVGTETLNVASAPGRGRRFLNFPSAVPGSYRYSVCAQLPTKTVCSIEKTFQIAQAPGNNNPPPVNFTAPTSVSATRVGASTQRIFWNHPGGAAGFRVYIKLPGNNNFSQAATVSGNERRADIGPLLFDTNYPVGVCAVNSTGQERCSQQINVFFRQGF